MTGTPRRTALSLPRMIWPVALVLVACRGAEPNQKTWDETPPPLVVEIQGPADAATAWETVVSVPTPAVRFQALVRADPNHLTAVTSPVPGVVVRTRPEGHATSQDVLAVVGVGSRDTGREVRVVAGREGIWHPRRQLRTVVWRNDTLGVLQALGYWLAVGTVNDVEYRVIHPGDPAAVRAAPGRGALSGKVEWVRPPWTENPYSADVAVEFYALEASVPDELSSVEVSVSAGLGDTVAAVPTSAVVQLPPGPAVFVPIEPHRYGVRWIAIGPLAGGLTVVRGAILPGTSVVARGLETLVSAARDSLARRRRRP